MFFLTIRCIKASSLVENELLLSSSTRSKETTLALPQRQLNRQIESNLTQLLTEPSWNQSRKVAINVVDDVLFVCVCVCVWCGRSGTELRPGAVRQRVALFRALGSDVGGAHVPPSASVAALGIRLLSVLVSCRKTPHNRNRLIDTFPPNDWPLLCSQPNRVCPIREDLTMTSFLSRFSLFRIV